MAHRCTCEHEKVEYCKNCRVVHCMNCNKEWADRPVSIPIHTIDPHNIKYRTAPNFGPWDTVTSPLPTNT